MTKQQRKLLEEYASKKNHLPGYQALADAIQSALDYIDEQDEVIRRQEPEAQAYSPPTGAHQ